MILLFEERESVARRRPSPFFQSSVVARLLSSRWRINLLQHLKDKRNLTGIKKVQIFTEGKNTLKNLGVFVFEFLGS